MRKINFRCDTCGNTDSRYIGQKLDGGVYCRRCVAYIGTSAVENPSPHKEVSLSLRYSLSSEQLKLSNSAIDNYINGIDTLIYAVCGAGKTELSFGVIQYALNSKQTVGFALPRRDVVIELFYRLKEAFPNQKVIAVYGDHNSQLEGDIVVLTTHQLYRYDHYFDLIIMDEIDAFPYKGNDVLQAMFDRSRRGHYILMSATPSKEIIDEFSKKGKCVLELRTRFHKRDIPVPRIIEGLKTTNKIFIVKQINLYKKQNKKCFIFAPTISECEALYAFISSFINGGAYVHSKVLERSRIIKEFKAGEYDYLVTTSVLERGVTFSNLQVIVFAADTESIYDSATLIQIAGRVGRKMDSPSGDVIFLCTRKTDAMKEAIDEIVYCNTFL